MRHIVLTIAMLAAAPTAFAQPIPPSQPYSGSNYQSTPNADDDTCCGPPIRGASQSGSSRSGMSTGQNSEENCGTPDEFKACPPMPRHPLPYYPSNRHD